MYDRVSNEDDEVLTRSQELKQSGAPIATSKSAQLISRLRLGKGFGGDKLNSVKIGKHLKPPPVDVEESGPPSPWPGSPMSLQRQAASAASPESGRRSPTISRIWQAEPQRLGWDEREHLGKVNLRRARAQSDPLDLRFESVGRMTRPRSAAAIRFREED